MSMLRREAVRVVVPASSANLGPGFDSAALALAVRDDLVAMITDDEGVLVEVVGEGAHEVPRDETHLVARSMQACFAWLDVPVAGFVLRCANSVPHGRGLGSSAAAIIGGIVLARAMVDDGRERMSDLDVLQLALAAEAHPDNLAAALHGGFTVAWLGADGRADAIRLDPHPGIRPMVFVPPDEVLTHHARALLPTDVPLADAAHNLARAALLVHAITTEPARLMTATEDRLHQRARAIAYPDSLALVDVLREAGIPAVISGAGPSVLAFPELALDATAAALASGRPWRIEQVDVARHGAREVPIPPLA
ncbi:MAG: homoserine kinase [Actinomycetota bacterium]|nr:homoserine kinase [Actinomycetota bacterium]